METAFKELNIPLVVTPVNMSSPELDELSSITYLSYYVKVGSPGYTTTLNWIKEQMSDETIENFSVTNKSHYHYNDYQFLFLYI